MFSSNSNSCICYSLFAVSTRIKQWIGGVNHFPIRVYLILYLLHLTHLITSLKVGRVSMYHWQARQPAIQNAIELFLSPSVIRESYLLCLSRTSRHTLNNKHAGTISLPPSTSPTHSLRPIAEGIRTAT